MLETDRQYSCHIRETDFKMKCLIQILSLQVITQSKIRLIADNFISYKEIFNSFSQKIMFLNIFISEFISYNSLNFSKKNIIILSLIKNTQEFDLQCRWISNQLHEKLKKNLSFVLHRNKILKKINYVYISHQEMIWNQFLKLYHDCFNKNYWSRDKILKLIQHYFIWNEIVNNICVYIVMYLIY